jgi:lipopolysaccharide export system permease protein
MSRLDWIVLRRVGARVGITVGVLFGIAALVNSLDTGRFDDLSRLGGPLLGLTGIVTNALRTTMATLPVTVLIGTIVGVLDLQARREMTIIKSTGASIWRIVRAPLYAAIVLGLFTGVFGWSAVLQADRYLDISQSHGQELWLEQHSLEGDYILLAERAKSYGTVLEGVTVFFTGGSHDRVEATSAKLTTGAWDLDGAIRYRADAAPENLGTLKIATETSPGDMRVKLTSVRDLTLPELWDAVSARIADRDLRIGALTSLYGLLILPALLGGSVLMGFAFTSGYRRTNKYGGAVLYGIVLGFVVYVVTELATRSGVAGVLDPMFAAVGPAFVAIVIGLTVLLYKEDGRA